MQKKMDEEAFVRDIAQDKKKQREISILKNKQKFESDNMDKGKQQRKIRQVNNYQFIC